MQRREAALLAVLLLLLVGLGTVALTTRVRTYEHDSYLRAVDARTVGWAANNDLTVTTDALCFSGGSCYLSATSVPDLLPRAETMLRQISGSRARISASCLGSAQNPLYGCEYNAEHDGVGVSMIVSARSHFAHGRAVRDPGAIVSVLVE